MVKSYITANDLQEWIDHLSEEERERPIVVSKKIFPKPHEILEPVTIGMYLAQHFDGFVIVVKENHKEIIKHRYGCDDNDT